MNALLLTGRGEPSLTFVAQMAQRTSHWRVVRDPVSLADVLAWTPDVIVSYNYRHLVPSDVLAVPPLGAWNLHPSLLPIGRGAHPIFWALAEGHPLGVSVHEMNAGLDRGPILAQTEIKPKPGESVRSLYGVCHAVLRALFWTWWDSTIKPGRGYPRGWTKPQTGPYTYHRAAHLDSYWPKLLEGWETPIEVVQGLGLEHGTAHR